MQPAAVEQILVIKLGALGDFIYALGPMKAIRAHHPQARITLLTTAPFAKLGKDCGYFDDVLIDAKPKWYDLSAVIAFARDLNQRKFTRVYDLQNNDRTAFYLHLFSPRPEWVGAARGASHRNTSPERTRGHSYHGHVQTLRLGGVEDVKLDDLSWMTGNLDKFPLRPPYVLLVPGCSPAHPEKRWPVVGYKDIARRLIAEGVQPVLLGTAAEADINAEIAAGLEVLNLTGQTAFYDIPALARGAQAAIGNDTGPAHMIAATGLPLVMLFCSAASTVKKHGPQGARAKTIEAADLTTISADDVWRVYRDALKR